jgi:hypothetical protein
MTENRINFTLTDAEQSTVETAFQTIINVLQAKSVVLSDLDRQTLPRSADGTLPFIEKVASYSLTHPQFKPDYVDANELNADVNGYKLSSRLLASANEVSRMIEDIAILSGSEAYSSSLSYYRNVKMQARDNRPGAKTVADDLAQRFAKPGKSKPVK